MEKKKSQETGSGQFSRYISKEITWGLNVCKTTIKKII